MTENKSSDGVSETHQNPDMTFVFAEMKTPRCLADGSRIVVIVTGGIPAPLSLCSLSLSLSLSLCLSLSLSFALNACFTATKLCVCFGYQSKLGNNSRNRVGLNEGPVLVATKYCILDVGPGLDPPPSLSLQIPCLSV